MIHDIYISLPTDQNFKPQLETNDEVTHIIQQIKMVLGTKPGQVLGSPSFGVYLEQYLFNLSYNKEEITKLVQDAITLHIQYDTTKYIVTIDINYGKDQTNAADYALVDIAINQRKCLGVIITL